MTVFPRNLYQYPNKDSDFPFYLTLERTAPRHVTSHRHDFLEIVLFVEGLGIERINGVEHVLEPGSITFMLPYQIHELYYTHSESLLYICNFDRKLLSHPYEGDWGSQSLLNRLSSIDTSFTKLTDEDFIRVKELFDAMWDEYRGSNPWRNLMLKSKLMETLVQFERSIASLPHLPVKQQPHNDRNIWPVIDYIHQHYREQLTLGDLAASFHFHTSYLSGQFKKQMGINFLDFLHNLRIRHACSLLLSTELPVTVIALEAGFGSFQTFSRLFRNEMNTTPAAYRKAHAEQGV